MKRKFFFIGLLLLHSIKNIPSNAASISYQIINHAQKRDSKTYTEKDLFDALRLLLVHQNNGQISTYSNGILIFVWDKYPTGPKTIHPTYSIKLRKFDDSKDPEGSLPIVHLNHPKLNDALKASKIPNILPRLQGMFLEDTFEIIQM